MAIVLITFIVIFVVNHLIELLFTFRSVISHAEALYTLFQFCFCFVSIHCALLLKPLHFFLRLYFFLIILYKQSNE